MKEYEIHLIDGDGFTFNGDCFFESRPIKGDIMLYDGIEEIKFFYKERTHITGTEFEVEYVMIKPAPNKWVISLKCID